MQNRNREADAFFHDYDYDGCTLNLGLDVLELLLAEDAPTTLEEMAARLSSPVDIVRHVVDFLATRGYLVHTLPDLGRPQGRLQSPLMNELRILTPAMRELVRHATPVMQRMSDDIGQSCNLSVPLGQHLLVIAQAQPATPFCINMPIGYKYGFTQTAPGCSWSAGTQAAPVINMENPMLCDVVDLSCLVTGNGGQVAVLTVPYLKTVDGIGLAGCGCEVTEAATAISDALASSRLVA